jgi:hypothetical protein
MKPALDAAGIPLFYGVFPVSGKNDPVEPPFVCYMASGQAQFAADNETYWKRNEYDAQYYYRLKNEAVEDAIEAAIEAAGYHYEKSNDTFIESENLFVIYYDIY